MRTATSIAERPVEVLTLKSSLSLMCLVSTSHIKMTLQVPTVHDQAGPRTLVDLPAACQPDAETFNPTLNVARTHHSRRLGDVFQTSLGFKEAKAATLWPNLMRRSTNQGSQHTINKKKIWTKDGLEFVQASTLSSSNRNHRAFQE